MKQHGDIHRRKLGIERQEHSLGLWQTKSKAAPRWLPCIHRMSRRSQVSQGLIKALVTQERRDAKFPDSSNWLDTLQCRAAVGPAPFRRSRKEDGGDELRSGNNIYLRAKQVTHRRQQRERAGRVPLRFTRASVFKAIFTSHNSKAPYVKSDVPASERLVKISGTSHRFVLNPLQWFLGDFSESEVWKVTSDR